MAKADVDVVLRSIHNSSCVYLHQHLTTEGVDVAKLATDVPERWTFLSDRLLLGVFSKLVCMRYHCTLHQTLYAWLMRGVWYWCGLESLIIGSYVYHSDVIAGTHAMLLI